MLKDFKISGQQMGDLSHTFLPCTSSFTKPRGVTLNDTRCRYLACGATQCPTYKLHTNDKGLSSYIHEWYTPCSHFRLGMNLKQKINIKIKAYNGFKFRFISEDGGKNNARPVPILGNRVTYLALHTLML